MKLKELDREFSVCKVEDYSLVDLSAEYSFIGKTDEENSLVCATGDVPSNVVERDGWWKGFRIQGGAGLLAHRDTDRHRGDPGRERHLDFCHLDL